MPTTIDPSLLDQLKNMLRRDLKLGADAVIADDMPLFGSDLDLDSLDILLLVTNIEKQLGVRIPNEEIGAKIFKDVATLAAYVQSHRGMGSSRPAVVEVPLQNWLDKLPHRDPFRFVSHVKEVQPGRSASGAWLLKGDEPFFAGHFPGKPIVPGMLIVEALAQISGLAGPIDAPPEGTLAHIDVRFERAVSPPVEIELRAVLTRVVGQLQVCDVQALVGDTVIARGAVTLQRGGREKQPMNRVAGLLLMLMAAVVRAQQPPATMPEGVDPELWRRMVEVDARGARIRDLVADFEQSKVTALLKKPMVSKGTVRVGPSAMLWNTVSPQPMSMRITEKEASIYYPQEKLMEVYPIAGQMAALAASPLPRLGVLREHFSFAPESARDLDPSADEAKVLALKLTPIDPAVREHVAQVRVLLDAGQGFMMRFEMTDPDGDRTVMSFSNVRANAGLEESQLTIRLGPDVKVVHPLENLGPPGAGAAKRSRP